MMRQNAGLYGYGLVSGGAIGGLSGGARGRRPVIRTPEQLLALKLIRNQKARERRANEKRRKAHEGVNYRPRAPRAPKREFAEGEREELRLIRNELARDRYARRKMQNALMIPGAVGYGLVGSGAQGYYGGRRRM